VLRVGEDVIESLDGILEHTVYRNPDTGWTVARLRVRGRRDPATVVGPLAAAQPGEELRLTGHWTTDPAYGQQFRAESVTTRLPSTTTGIQTYLGSGLVRGFGHRMAARLVSHFGTETLAVIETQPERLQDVRGIGPIRASRLRAAWAEQRAIRDVMVFLHGHGISPAFAVRIYKRYGDEAATVIRQDPYRLAEDIRGIGFATADRVAGALGIAADAPARLRAGLVHTLYRCTDDGHVYVPRAALLCAAEKTLRGAREETPITTETLRAALDDLIAFRRVVAEPDDDDARIFLPALHGAERGIASRVARLVRTPMRPFAVDLDRALAWYEQRQRITLAPRQREAIIAGVREKALIVTGGPGTGKTTLLRAIVEIHDRKGRRVLLCAPTGRAAQRLAETSGHEAQTIHRLLGVDPATGRFKHDERCPLAADLVIADEASMIDTTLADALLRAVPPEAQLILVGDVDQLPSVGPGNVLADLIDSGVPRVVRLTAIFRQAQTSLIVTNAHRINRGEVPVSTRERGDFFWIPSEDPEEIVRLTLRIATRDIPRKFGILPDEIQILSPMRRGPLGAIRLNQELQARLNPGGAPVGNGATGFRIGDRVMQTENDYRRDVYNGDLGRIERCDRENASLQVRIRSRLVEYDLRDLSSLDLAYAISIHKAQGSEYPAVVIPIHTQHYVLLTRRLLYTAVTRGRRLVVLIGHPRALALALRNALLAPRNTRLRECLRDAMAAAAIPDPPVLELVSAPPDVAR
jgi:exodeoxyribonuclease V alpha subunit